MSHFDAITSYFSLLDIDNLRLHLKDDYTYENTTKEIFLDQIDKVFDAYKNSGDTELIKYEGKCAGETCSNCGKKGYRFVGNHSKNYMDLIFEIDGDDIKDIYECPQFETDLLIEDLAIKAEIGAGLHYRNSLEGTQEWSVPF